MLRLHANAWHGVSYGTSQVSHALREVVHGGLTAGHGNHQARTQDGHSVLEGSSGSQAQLQAYVAIVGRAGKGCGCFDR